MFNTIGSLKAHKDNLLRLCKFFVNKILGHF